jgi:hypothetical protein
MTSLSQIGKSPVPWGCNMHIVMTYFSHLAELMPTVTKIGVPRAPRPKVERNRPEGLEYTSRWDRFSRLYRRANPFCRFCKERGLFNLGSRERPNLVDHKYPLMWGGEMFPGADGVQTLCVSCHGVKSSLESYAAKTGQQDQIVLWCDDPSKRPRVY